MRVHDLSCEAVQIQLPSPVLAPKPDLASRGLRKSPPAKEIHITKTKQGALTNGWLLTILISL
jgi:hypothetical protein